MPDFNAPDGKPHQPVHPTPLIGYNADAGVGLSEDGTYWMIRVIPNARMDSGTREDRARAGSLLTRVLQNIGSTAGKLPPGGRSVAAKRYPFVKKFSIDVPSLIEIPSDAGQNTRDYLAETTRQITGRSHMCVVATPVDLGRKSGDAIVRALSEKGRRNKAVSDLADGSLLHITDFERVDHYIELRNAMSGTRIPTDRELDIVSFWWSIGESGNHQVINHYDHLHIFTQSSGYAKVRDECSRGRASLGVCDDWPTHLPGHYMIAMGWMKNLLGRTNSATTDMMELELGSDSVFWIPRFFSHYNGLAVVESFLLEPNSGVLGELEKAGRTQEFDARDRAKKGHDDSAVDHSLGELQAGAMARFQSTGEAAAAQCSTVVAMAMNPNRPGAAPPWRTVSEALGISFEPAMNHQVQALREAQLGAGREDRVSPNVEDMTVNYLGWNGGQSASTIGDPNGTNRIFLGRVTSSSMPAWMSLDEGISEGALPFIPIVATTGGGKTMLLFSIVGQHLLQGRPAEQQDYKPRNTNIDFVNLIRSYGISANLASIGEVESLRGATDPFFFMPPQLAGAMLANAILMVDPWEGSTREFPEAQDLTLRKIIDQGIQLGGTSSEEVLRLGSRTVDGGSLGWVAESILDVARTFPQFGMRIGRPEDRSNVTGAVGGLMFYEMGENGELNIPSSGSVQDWKMDARATSEMIAGMMQAGTFRLSKKRGLSVFDEAWAPLRANPTGITELLRVARHEAVTLIMATQFWRDVSQHSGVMSRALVGYIETKAEAGEAASDAQVMFKDLGITATEERIRRQASLRFAPAKDGRPLKPAEWLYYDKNGKWGIIYADLNPRWLSDLSTRMDDREARAAKREAQEAAEGLASLTETDINDMQAAADSQTRDMVMATERPGLSPSEQRKFNVGVIDAADAADESGRGA